MDPVSIDGSHLTIFDIVHVVRDGRSIVVPDSAWDRVRKSREQVDRVIASGGRAYGVNTGVGSQKASVIDDGDASSFNRRLLVAHATTASHVQLAPHVVRAAMLVQLNAFASGRSGVSEPLLRKLLERFRAGEVPRANAGASVGASDLVPLSQIALSLIGSTNPLESPPDPDDVATETVPPSIELRAKEALSLINSNAVSLGHGALILLHARKLLRGFDLSFALALEGFRGNLNTLHPAVLAAHPQPGQVIATQHIRRLLEGSALLEFGQARNLQDPLSFRCAPQVHGAVYSALEWVWTHLEIELNTSQDNPCVAEDTGELISHGNMDGTLLTLAFDNLRAALVAALDLSAQRLHKLHWPEFSGLPSGLTDHPSALGGVQFLNLSHIAEAYAAAARRRAQPSLLNYQGQLADGVEDYATLLPLAITDAEHLIDSAWVVQALEIVVACWAIRRRGIPIDSLGRGLRKVYDRIQSLLPIGREGTEVFDVRPIVDLVRNEEIVDLIDDASPPVPEFELPEVPFDDPESNGG